MPALPFNMVARVSAQVPKFLLRLPVASAQTKHLARSPTVWSFGIRRGRYIAFTPAYSQNRASRVMERAITTPLFLITSIQPLYFHTIARSFACATISHAFNSLRTLSIAIGGGTPLTLSGVGEGSALSFRPCPLRWPLPAPNSSDPQRGRGAHIQLLLLQAQGFQVHGRSH